jgi:hypothetical protein
MTSAGSIVLYGSDDNQVNGALLASDGTLDKSGTIAPGGEGNYRGSVGSTLLNTGDLTNSG